VSGLANDCFTPGAPLADRSNVESANPAFAGRRRGAGRCAQDTNTSRIVTPIARLDSPSSRIRASFSGPTAPYFRPEGAASAPPPEPRMALKNSELLSTTITSDFLLKLAR
jgi:hypothetical protein